MEREVYYNGVVDYSDDEGHASMIVGGDTLEEALFRLIKSSLYYVGLGYAVIIKNVERFCSACDGKGSVRKGKRVYRDVKCPMCRGKDSRKVILELIPIAVPESVRVITD